MLDKTAELPNRHPLEFPGNVIWIPRKRHGKPCPGTKSGAVARHGMTEPDFLLTTPREQPLAEAVQALPHVPGVYLFKDCAGTILYAGKARDLKKRVSSYFRSPPSENIKTRVLLSKTASLEFAVTATEKEALLLEAGYIKKYRPRYNVVLRDDKNYPALRLDLRDPFPRLEIVRRIQKDGALYFGPYPSAHAVRETVRFLHQLFPLRLCKSKRLSRRERACLNHSMGRCPAPCVGNIDPEEYGRMVREVVLFLQGKTDALQRQLQRSMEEASQSLEFERAAVYRDRLHAVRTTLEKQVIVSDRFLDQDVVGIHRDPDGIEMAVLFVRQGVAAGQRHFDLKDAHGETEELLASFIQQFYGEDRFIPDEILVPGPFEGIEVLEEWLRDLKGKRVHIRPARRGRGKQLLDLAEKNARERLQSRRKSEKRDRSLLEGLQRILRLPKPPLRIGCVDISNLQGRHAVGALAVFSDGRPHKESYRRYRIASKEEPDDPAMMAEVIERLVTRERELADTLDLLMLDGGKGQLNRIVRVLSETGMADRLPVISIAKERGPDRGEKGRGLYEKIYVPGRRNPLFLARFPDILHLLQRLRDEAHRFAVTHYQALHRRELLLSALDAVPGIGVKRRRILLDHFGGMDSLREASLEELEQVPGIPPAVAKAIFDFLSAQSPEASSRWDSPDGALDTAPPESPTTE